MAVNFREGQDVRKGELLAQIDPRPFQVQLTQAEGQMARDMQILDNAKVDLKRYELLWSQNSIPKQQLDTQAALVRQYDGVVKSDQGAIDAAKLDLVYCRITAPVSGRVGLRLVDAGNIVHASRIQRTHCHNPGPADYRDIPRPGGRPAAVAGEAREGRTAAR